MKNRVPLARAIAGIAVLGLLCGCEGSYISEVQKVQDRAVKVCGYLPAANSVALILAAANPQVQGASAIASGICMAVLQWQAQLKEQKNSQIKPAIAMPCPRVNGICVEGSFINHP